MHKLISLLAAVLVAIQPWSARAADLPPEKQVLLLVRALSFDRALPSRVGDIAVVAIAFKPGHAASEDARRSFLAAMAKLPATTTLAGKPVKAVALPFLDAATFNSRLRESNAVALYVTPGLSEAAADLSSAARTARLLSFTSTEALVNAGLSIGLLMEGQKPRLLVNVNASKAEGAELDSALLRVAEVVK